MKTILLPIHPEWCEKIFSGEKTIEIRKTAPEPPFKVLSYCTRGGDYLVHMLDNTCRIYPKRDYRGYEKKYGKEPDFMGHKLNGKVIGEFIVEKVYYVIPFGLGSVIVDSDNNMVEPKTIIENSCLTEQQIVNYLGEKSQGTIWHITASELYDKPRKLNEFKRWQKYTEYGNGFDHPPYGDERLVPITRPPQNWMYIQDPEEEI